MRLQSSSTTPYPYRFLYAAIAYLSHIFGIHLGFLGIVSTKWSQPFVLPDAPSIKLNKLCYAHAHVMRVQDDDPPENGD